jgi:hypothetical protein
MYESIMELDGLLDSLFSLPASNRIVSFTGCSQPQINVCLCTDFDFWGEGRGRDPRSAYAIGRAFRHTKPAHHFEKPEYI